MSVAQEVRDTRRAAVIPRTRPHRDTLIGLLVASVIAGCAGVLASAELGSGDYGQWLMAARPYLGEQIPAYRLDAAVPPVVPMIIGAVASLVPDRLAALHVAAVLLLAAVGIAAYLCAASLFRSRLAGALAVVATLLLTDAFLELFAFGGLLQAGAIAWLWLAMAAFAVARREPRRRRWWVSGALAVGMGALTHVGTAAIAVPAGIAAATLASFGSRANASERGWRLLPLAAVLSVIAVFWVAVLLPGGTELARNPASLNYRGPTRLWESLSAFPPTLAMMAIAGVGIVVGCSREWRRRRYGSWGIVAAWTAATGAVVVAAIVSGAATDYPRFATPILAPLVVAAGGTLAIALRMLATAVRGRVGVGTSRGWTNAIVTAAVVVAIPWSVIRFESQISGYRLRDTASVAAVSAWIDAELPNNSTVLAPVREAKWIEGLTGHATLFSGSVRYSFRSDEWQRSLAADTLLRSTGSIVNGNFFVKLSDGDPATDVPRTLTIGANHGGEYVDLMRTVPGETRILGASAATPPLARLANLPALRRDEGTLVNRARVTLRWADERYGTPVTFRQTIGLRPTASTLELTYGATTDLPSAGFVVSLAPASGVRVTDVSAAAGETLVTFAPLGSSSPRLRFAVSGDGALFSSPDGTLELRSGGGPVRLLVTDLTASVSPEIPLGVLRPPQLLDRYGVDAAILPRDSVYGARLERLEALGFDVAAEFGFYSVLRRSAEPGASP